jgi:hypothetical protein
MVRNAVLVLILASVLVPLSAFAQTASSIEIVTPGDRRNVALGQVEVTVEITTDLPESSYTWQILVDGIPQGMAGGTTTVVQIDRPTGPHRLRAELYDGQGTVIGSDEILVIAAPVERRDPIFNREWYSPLMALFILVVLGIVLLGLWLKPRPVT